MRWRQWGVVGLGLLAFLVLPPVAEAFGKPDLITLGTQVAIFALAAVSLDLLIGYAGLSSFGHAAFFGLGAYTVGILAFHAAEDTSFLGLLPGQTEAWVVWPPRWRCRRWRRW